MIQLRRSKTDQDGQGRKVGLPYGSNPATCPVHALQAWIEAAAVESGSLFRHINLHGQKFNPAGHGLRSGLATAAAIAGAAGLASMNRTGHRSGNMVWRYTRDASLFGENAAAAVGL